MKLSKISLQNLGYQFTKLNDELLKKIAYILLFLSYYFLITPISFLMKLLRRDELKLKWKSKKTKTYWEPAKPINKDSLTKQF
tara:strand:+ start:706 stop:954 length:249 start_codon:yes stop_codon:yes gene_type:complete